MLFRLYPLILIIQVFCLWHAYKNRSDQKWFWLIIFFPLIGGIIYLYDHFYNRENIGAISETVKATVNSNYHVQKLEKELEFSNSILNRRNLADAYTNEERYDEAIELYESCLVDFNAGNVEVLKRLVNCYYQIENHVRAAELGARIEGEKVFRNAQERIAYAWSLYETQDYESAERNFNGMDSRYSNYIHRIEFSKFLNKMNRTSDALEKLEEITTEFSRMNSSELRPWRNEQRIARDLQSKYAQ